MRQATATVVEAIDGALAQLEEARMWTNRAFAEKAGVTEFADVQKTTIEARGVHSGPG